MKKAVGHFLRVSLLVTKSGVFSSNEILEDVNTSDLKYLLTDFYLGDLYTKVSTTDRLKAITTAQGYFTAFLDRCLSYAILMKAEKDGYEQVEAPSKDPAVRRQLKIDRHKKKKELKIKVETLTAQIAKAGLGEDEDEETDRDLTESLIHLFIENSIENLSLIKEETQMLQWAEAKRQAGEDPLKPLQPQQPQQPFKPIVIQNTREVLQQQVFRPGWNQPTMTLDQYVMLEQQRGNILTGGGPDQEVRMEREKEEKLERDSEEDADTETMKKREWDEFADANPRGQGNRYNRS